MLPLLKFGSDRKIHSTSEFQIYLSKELQLTENELNEENSSGNKIFQVRIAWAKTYLKKAGLIMYPERGSFQITANGLTILQKKKIKRIDKQFLSQFPEFKEFLQTSES